MDHSPVGRRAFISLLGGGAIAVGLPPWAGQAFGSQPPTARVDAERIAATIAEMTLAQKVGQLFIPYVYGSDAEQFNAQNKKIYGVGSIAEVIETYQVGGIIYFGWSDNLNTPAQVARLSNQIQATARRQPPGIPALVSIDQEEGVVVRLPQPSTQLPGSMALGATGSRRLALLAARVTGSELMAVGVNQNYAPISDVNVNALNPVIGVRSFGGDPKLVTELVQAQVEGFHGAGIASTVKHFPGHGDTETDSHVGLPVINHDREEFERLDLPPFAQAINSGVDAVMTAHIVVPALDPSGRPATLSHAILTGLLREELNYEGVIVTDSLAMEGVRTMFGDDRVPVEAIKAGADQLLMPPKLGVAIDGVIKAVDDGEISLERLDRSVERVLEMKMKRGLYEHKPVDVGAVSRKLDSRAHRSISRRVAEASITLLRNEDAALPVAPGAKVLVTGWGSTKVGVLAGALTDEGLAATAKTAIEPSAEEIAAVMAMAEAHEVVVVTTHSAGFGISAAQQRLVAALVGSGKPVLAVAIRNPYDVAHHAETAAALVTYGYADVSMTAVARVIAGKVAPSGKLPVAIPEPDGTGTTVRYPLGYGLTF